MNASHTSALHGFARKVSLMLAIRAVVQAATVGLFIWGALVLTFRIFGAAELTRLALMSLAVLPFILVAMGWRAWRQPPAFQKIRATYDQLNACGGLVMAAEKADMGAWQAHLPGAGVPTIRWNNGRALLQMALALAFAATAVLIPDRLTQPLAHRHLEIGSIVDQLQEEVKTLAQEKIVPEKQADQTQKQLSELEKDSASFSPDKTWEALDQIKESDQNIAKQAAEEAVNKTAALTQAGTMAEAMKDAADAGMSPETALQAAQNLASMLNSAKLENGILNGSIPPELLANLNGLNKEQLKQLMSAMAFSKNKMDGTMSKLAGLHLIDPSQLAACKNAGTGHNSDALAAYLSSCTNSSLSMAECLSLCRGGTGRGGPGAPMTWKDGTSEEDTKFNEHALPPSDHLSDALMVGVSKTAPQLSNPNEAEGQGALVAANAGGGSAHVQTILPEHRQAVQNYFKREN
jgi:hypothetical protein